MTELERGRDDGMRKGAGRRDHGCATKGATVDRYMRLGYVSAAIYLQKDMCQGEIRLESFMVPAPCRSFNSYTQMSIITDRLQR